MVSGGAVDNALNKDIPFEVGSHFVTLVSPIEMAGNTNYIAKVMTWGRVRTIVFKASQISRALRGWVAVDMGQLGQNNNL